MRSRPFSAINRASRKALKPRVFRLTLAVLILTIVLPSVRAEAAVIQVTTELDEVSDDGQCSLREAVISANTDLASGALAGECGPGSGPDTIVIPTGFYGLTRAGASEDAALTGDLDIVDSLTLQGAGQEDTIIHANGLDRVVHVREVLTDFTVGMSQLTIAGGDVKGDGGGILNHQSLSLESVSLIENSSGDDGGGVYSTGDLTIDSVMVMSNSSADDGAGLYAAPTSDVSISDSTFASQVAGGTGGGIYNAGSLNVLRSTLASNQSTWGAGIHNLGDAVVSESTIAGNNVLLWAAGFANEGIATVLNSTISSNSAPEYGANVVNLSVGTLDLKHVTIADGTSPAADAVQNDGYVKMTNSILEGACAGIGLDSIGGNLESPADTCNLTRIRDRRNVSAEDLDLYPLDEYGGPTLTHRIGPMSLAIDLALTGQCLPTDQRGSPRPIDGDGDDWAKCDSGSVEVFPSFFEDGFESGDTSAWDETRP